MEALYGCRDRCCRSILPAGILPVRMYSGKWYLFNRYQGKEKIDDVINPTGYLQSQAPRSFCLHPCDFSICPRVNDIGNKKILCWHFETFYAVKSTGRTLPIISVISWSVCSPTLSCYIKQNLKTDIENSRTADVMSRDYKTLLLVIYDLHCWGNDPMIKTNKRSRPKWATYPKKLVESKWSCEQWTTMTNQALLLKYIRE